MSADKTVASYLDAFGTPEDIPIPDDFKTMGATRFLYWELPQHHLRVILAYLPDNVDPNVINVYGQFIHPDIASEFLLRSDPMGGLAPKPSLKQQQANRSSDDRQIESLIADPKWGRVAFKINRLCSGHLSQNEILHHILKTKSLAKMGNFSPGFTLQLLESAEIEASKQQLSPVFAVTTCEQSLAFSGGIDAQSIPK